jgi:hypothetical protein
VLLGLQPWPLPWLKVLCLEMQLQLLIVLTLSFALVQVAWLRPPRARLPASPGSAEPAYACCCGAPSHLRENQINHQIKPISASTLDIAACQQASAEPTLIQ